MFDQIKAKLGLDITSFQRGLAASQKDLSKFQENARGKLMSFFAPAAILAGITSVINKAQELRDKAIEAGEAFSDSVRQTAEMGDNIDRAKNFLFELAAKGLAAYQSRIENVTAATIALFNPKLTREQILKNLQEQKKLEAQGNISDKEAEKREKDRAEKEKKDIQEIGKNFKAAADEREKRKFEELSLDDKIAKRNVDLAQAQKDYNDQSKTAVERSAALARSEQIKTELKDLNNKKTDQQKTLEEGVAEVVSMITETQKENTAEEKKQVELAKEKRRELEAQKKAMEGQIRDARRDMVLPTMAEVSSGARNIGDPARRKVQALEKERARSLRLADRYQRDFDRANDPNVKGSQREAAMRQLKESNDALKASQLKIKAGEESLQFRVKDANPFSNMETSLSQIQTELSNLNTKTLGSTGISTT